MAATQFGDPHLLLTATHILPRDNERPGPKVRLTWRCESQNRCLRNPFVPILMVGCYYSV